MKLFKFGLIIAVALGFASFVYYRVQTLPQTPTLEISFGKAGADITHPQVLPKGKFKFVQGKVTHEPAKTDVDNE